MILELAQNEIKPGMAEEFERGVAAAIPIFQAAPGFISLSLHRGIENPLLYRVYLEWEKIEDHTEGFRNSEGFKKWRELVGHCFAIPPKVDHSECVLKT